MLSISIGKSLITLILTIVYGCDRTIAITSPPIITMDDADPAVDTIIKNEAPSTPAITSQAQQELEETRDLISHLQDVLLLLNQAARGKTVSLSSLPTTPQALLKKAKAWAKRYSHYHPETTEASQQPVDNATETHQKQLVEKAELIANR